MNAVDITPRSYGWATAPGKCNDSGSCSGVKLQSVRVGLSHVLVSCLDRQTDGCLAVVPGSPHSVGNNEQPACTDRLGRVLCSVQFSGRISHRT